MEFKTLENSISSKTKELGYELISLAHKVVKGENVLEIIVDRIQPIDMNDIVELSHSLNEFLDELDPFSHPYTLDISSLGAEKPLKVESLNDYVGSYVNVHIVNPIEGINIFEGSLDAVEEDKIKLSYKIKTRTKTVDITKSNISKIRLAIKF
ncbi:MAG: ribosome maturation factor RimP [Bacilli bacterium]|nr:ribosome maturation factor RimP [Bacilli bacterium]